MLDHILSSKNNLSSARRIIINLPEEVADRLELLVHKEKTSNDEIFYQAIMLYLDYFEHRRLVEEMKKGYEEMGTLNVTLAEEGLHGGTSKK